MQCVGLSPGFHPPGKAYPCLLSDGTQELGLRDMSHILSQGPVDMGISAHQRAGVGTSRLGETSGKVAGGEKSQVRLISLSLSVASFPLE